MCGIAGKVYFNNSIVKLKDLKAMSDKISHRGPDDEGFYISDDKRVGFAHRRLSIIDLSQKGHQPMTYKNRYHITFNGEIYNFLERRNKLRKNGYRFFSKTDTEVILALYDKYGVKCLEYLRGMFSFAIYDAKEKTIFLARDRIGKKPQKYYVDENVFIFGSELKGILTQKEVKKEPDFHAIHDFLTYGYVPSPKTGFVNIKKLEPAHYILIDLKNKKFTKKRYWDLDFSEKLNLSENEWKKEILSVLEEATKLRLIADVPIGVFLSGGIDSSAVVSMMSKHSSGKVKTFTISFDDKRFNESPYARKVSDLFNTEHTVLIAEPEAIDSLPELVGHFEEPFADNSTIVTYMISKLARDYVTVILNGDGGDENFAGYSRYNRLNRDVAMDRYGKYSRPILLPITRNLSSLSGVNFFKRSHKFLEKSKKDLVERYLSYFGLFNNEEKKELYSDYFVSLLNSKDSLDYYRQKVSRLDHTDARDKILYADITSYLTEDLLTKLDLASMKVGLEGRSPFIDHKLMELAAKIPFNLKLKGQENKYILKKSLEGILPDDILYRTKIGFTIPLGAWFAGKFNSYARSVLERKGSISSKLFKKGYINNLLNSHSEKNDYGVKLWTLLVLELWYKEYFA